MKKVQAKILAGAAVAAFVFLAAGLAVRKYLQTREAAWERLAIAQSLAYQGQDVLALNQIRSLEAGFGKAPAVGFGLLFSGDVLYQKGKYAEASELYKKVLDRGEPRSLMPFALSDLALSQEAGGNCNEAVSTTQRFLDSYQDHFLAPQVHASLARCLDALGQKDKAKAAYERMGLLYPETYWSRWAQARQDNTIHHNMGPKKT